MKAGDAPPKRGSWSVYAHCSLCSARTASYQSNLVIVARAAAEREAKALGFIELPPVTVSTGAGVRIRVGGHAVCRDCAREIAALAGAAS